MAQQVEYRDLALGWNRISQHRLAGSIRLLDRDTHVREFGQVPGHRIAQIKPSLFVKHHNGDTGDGLGHRVHAKDRVLSNWLGGFLIGHSKSLEVSDAASPGYETDSAAQLVVLDVSLSPG